MRILPIRNEDDFREVAETILANSLADPAKEQLLETLIADPAANRRELVHTAFSLGVMAALDEFTQGHIIGVLNKEN